MSLLVTTPPIQLPILSDRHAVQGSNGDVLDPFGGQTLDLFGMPHMILCSMAKSEVISFAPVKIQLNNNIIANCDNISENLKKVFKSTVK